MAGSDAGQSDGSARERDRHIMRLIHDTLCVAAREAAGHEASPTIAIIDAQCRKAAQKGLCSRPAGL